MQTTLQISSQEFAERQARLLDHVRAEGAEGVVLFDSFYIHYYTRFAFIPTERPMAFAMSASGETLLFVPRLELEHAQGEGVVDRVATYVEYPDDPHPMMVLQQVLREMGMTGSLLADHDGYPWVWGYQGPPLSEVVGAAIRPVAAFIEAQMAIKSPAEIALLRESSRWANLAHRLLQKYTRPGVTETEVSMRASAEATAALLDTLGPLYRSLSPWADGPEAGYRGQIGRQGAIPHSLTMNTVFQPGDLLVTGATAPVWGYHAELERTMVIGRPTDEQRRFFDLMVGAQETALSHLRAGVRCSEVDRAVRRYFAEHELEPYWRHHSGHGIGLRYHEGPFLDIGDQTELRPGMVLTVEPGIYVPELGGFRHSDTVVITEDGHERLTYYPRDLESLCIPV